MAVRFRPVTPADHRATYALFVEATNALHAELNLPPVGDPTAPPPRSMAFRRHAQACDGAHFLLAEADGATIGYGSALRRDDIWYLAALHVVPAFQGQGIGRTLLRRLLEPAGRHFTIAEAIQPVSVGLYASSGMLPREPLLSYVGHFPARLPTPSRRLRVQPDAGPITGMDEIDRVVLGCTRPQDHAFWLAVGLRRFRVEDGQGPVGYFYLGDDGAVGPVAVCKPADMGGMLALAAHTLRQDGIGQISLKVPGTDAAAVAFASGLGLRLHGPAHLLMASTLPWQQGRYLLSNGDALF